MIPLTEHGRKDLADAPAVLRRNATAVSMVCMIMLAAAIAVQILATLEIIEDPWLPLGTGFLSSAAIGLDAMVVGVRKRWGVGPSIANLAPGDWAFFGVMLWLVAVPAYLIGARRRARRPLPEETPDHTTRADATYRSPAEQESEALAEQYEPIRSGSWVALILVTLLGLMTSLSSLAGR